MDIRLVEALLRVCNRNKLRKYVYMRKIQMPRLWRGLYDSIIAIPNHYEYSIGSVKINCDRT
jgi:hypothetical protein